MQETIRAEIVGKFLKMCVTGKKQNTVRDEIREQ
jgi:hypothetical protein